MRFSLFRKADLKWWPFFMTNALLGDPIWAEFILSVIWRRPLGAESCSINCSCQKHFAAWLWRCQFLTPWRERSVWEWFDLKYIQPQTPSPAATAARSFLWWCAFGLPHVWPECFKSNTAIPGMSMITPLMCFCMSSTISISHWMDCVCAGYIGQMPLVNKTGEMSRLVSRIMASEKSVIWSEGPVSRIIQRVLLWHHHIKGWEKSFTEPHRHLSELTHFTVFNQRAVTLTALDSIRELLYEIRA